MPTLRLSQYAPSAEVHFHDLGVFTDRFGFVHTREYLSFYDNRALWESQQLDNLGWNRVFG